MKTTIGGDRIGSGNKQNVSMKNYSRSTHDLSYLWRSSMSAGTLVPFMSELGLPGDSFDINLKCEVLTLPTVGPLFGSYKVQLDVYQCPIRLYNGKLHMNKLGIGMDMSQIKLPQVEMKAKGKPTVVSDNEQINSSSIWSYLNIRGLGVSETEREITREFSALSYLSYWDVYKQYYANKQEEEGVVIHAGQGEAVDYQIVSALYNLNGNTAQLLGNTVSVYMGGDCELTINLDNGNGTPIWSQVKVYNVSLSAEETFMEMFETYENISETVVRGKKYIGSNSGTHTMTVEQDQSIGSTISTNPDGKPNLVRFPLENIDTMREDILSNVKSSNAFKINNETLSPYGLSLTKNTQDIYAKQIGQEGLAIKTYQSDLFNNWISTEWIDGTNGVNEVTAVDTSDGKFTIDALNLAGKVYNMLNRIAISGGSYDDWLDAVYTEERAKSVESPIYAGSLIKELSFEEVISTGDTTNQAKEGGQPLGTLAGRGKLGAKNKGGRIKIKVDEPSYILGLVSLTPRVDYSQGNKWDTSLKTMNDFHKPELGGIGYQDLVTDSVAWFDTLIDTNDDIQLKSAGKQPAWINYMTNVNQVRGSFADKDDSMWMVLNRRYEADGINGIKDMTTYIDPSKYNHIFADTRLDAQNFWVQISNNITARRKMSAKIIPNL